MSGLTVRRSHILEIIVAVAIIASALVIFAGPRIWTQTFRSALSGRPAR
jgi:hypothetical protein